MKQFFIDIFHPCAKLLAAFDNHTKGYSIRKIIAATFTGMVIYVHIKYVDLSVTVSTLLIDCGFIALLLGLVTADQLIRFKSSSSNTTEVTHGGSGESDYKKTDTKESGAPKENESNG